MPYVEYDEVEAICPDCGRTFRSEDALAAHREESHSGIDEPGPHASRETPTICPVCHREFASPTVLRAHTREVHSGR
ncbi:MAG: C2H2-type zinc finger protein [Thermoplasmata archaeon]